MLAPAPECSKGRFGIDLLLLMGDSRRTTDDTVRRFFFYQKVCRLCYNQLMHTLPPLPYAYDALEPYLDEATMRLHHTKHHQAYIDKLNAALEPYPALAELPIEKLLGDLTVVPESIRSTVINHGGGHYNHSLFWRVMRPVVGESNLPPTRLTELLDKNFGDFATFQKQFKEAALARFGSGWVWLRKQGSDTLTIVSTANQDVPLAEGQPILGLDIWEHAYYLKYQNRRADYVDAWFNLINWDHVASLAF